MLHNMDKCSGRTWAFVISEMNCLVVLISTPSVWNFFRNRRSTNFWSGFMLMIASTLISESTSKRGTRDSCIRSVMYALTNHGVKYSPEIIGGAHPNLESFTASTAAVILLAQSEHVLGAAPTAAIMASHAWMNSPARLQRAAQGNSPMTHFLLFPPGTTGMRN